MRPFRHPGLSLALALSAVLLLFASAGHAFSGLQSFAACIRDSGSVFYGAWWCPSCERQLDRFGSAARLLPYVECSDPGRRNKRSECAAAGVTSYPTWVFPDGSVETGGYSLERLAAFTGCPPPRTFMP